MIEIRGRKFSENTIIEALKAHCDWKEEIKFEAGDVLTNGLHSIRIIISVDGKLVAYGNDGRGTIEISELKHMLYKKIGRIQNIKFN